MNHLLPVVSVNTIEPSKFNIEMLKQSIVTHFVETGENPLELLVKSEAVVKLLEGIRADLKEQALNELSKHPQGKAEVLGATISKAETGVKYAYDSDYTWQTINAELESLKHRLKERETLLKSLTSPVVDPETGEMIHPAVKYSTTSFKIELKK